MALDTLAQRDRGADVFEPPSSSQVRWLDYFLSVEPKVQELPPMLVP